MDWANNTLGAKISRTSAKEVPFFFAYQYSVPLLQSIPHKSQCRHSKSQGFVLNFADNNQVQITHNKAERRGVQSELPIRPYR